MKNTRVTFHWFQTTFSFKLVGLVLLAGLLLAGSVHGTAAEPQAEESICGSINSNKNWTSDTLYVANGCTAIIEAGVTVTVSPGTTVKLGGASSALIVRGTLDLQGTTGSPIAITSLHDNAHGDPAAGGTGAPAAGDWYGMVFEVGSSGMINNTFIGYAGSGAWNGDAALWNRAQVDVNAASINIQNTVITNGVKEGIHLQGEGLAPMIKSTQVSNNISGGAGYAIYQSTVNMDATYENLTFSGNDRDEVIVHVENLTRNVTLGGAPIGFDCGFTYCPLVVTTGNTLTVQPGAVLNFAYPYGMWIQVQSGGALQAVGTPTMPISMTRGGVEVQFGGSAHLSQCDIDGKDVALGNQLGLYILADDVEVSDCKVHNHVREGVYIESQASTTIHPVFENVEINDNGQSGLYLDARTGSSLSVTMKGGSISGNGRSGVYGNTWTSMIYPTFSDVTINGNGATSGGQANYEMGINLEGGSTQPKFSNLTVTNNIGNAINWNCDGTIWADDLNATGNGRDALVMPGCYLTTGRQWDLKNVGIPVHIAGDVTVPTGALLSITPGTTLSFDTNKRIYVDGGSLYALGMVDDPIVFTGLTETPGSWRGIYLTGNGPSTGIMRHCEIAYAGADNQPSFQNSYDNTVIMQHCKVHDSNGEGIESNHTAVLNYNEIYDNAEAGVARYWSAPQVDARNNWWGDASGPYHPTSNPSGIGGTVGDGVLFEPWLTAPPEGGEGLGGMLVATGAPALVSPGQTIDYSVQYLNLMTDTVKDAVLMIQLPRAAEYLSSTQGGIFWPERDQVFWKLGDLAPGAQGFLSMQVRFQWGLPLDYADGSITLFAGENYNTTVFDLDEYLDYESVTNTAHVTVTEAEFGALRAAHPDLETLYNQAVNQGYVYLQAAEMTYSDGSKVTWAAMRTPDRRAVRVLTQTGDQSMAITSTDDLYMLHDTTGGMKVTLSTMQREYWGNWLPGEEDILRTTSDCSQARCLMNCTGRKVTFKVISTGIAQTILWTVGSGGVGIVSGAVHVAHVAKMIYDCHQDCKDPDTHCCKDGQVRWSPGGFMSYFVETACVKEVCSGHSFAGGGTIYCAFGQRCVAGIGDAGGCKDCDGSGGMFQPVTIARSPAQSSACSLSADGSGDCTDTGLLIAKDPNAIYGPQGDLLPGQTTTYTITYENEGAGRAYGVYVLNELPPVFDEGSLDLHGTGEYLPLTREIVWMVGELGPKGDPDSKGTITYTVALSTGLPSGTVVSNQAVVYFSSVPEETPTNTWVNVVAPLVAIPQTITTNYMTAVGITLKGLEVSSLPLTFEVVEYPRFGTLSGTAPNLTYTPIENFTGADGFNFTVSNGTSTGRLAQVRISVEPTGDSTAPQIIWVEPEDNLTGVPVGITPIYTDKTGAVYAPGILAGFSEPLDEATLTAQTVTLKDSNGKVVSVSLTYDPIRYQVLIQLRERLSGTTTYTVTFTSGVTDQAGNALSGAPYDWSFTTAESTMMIFMPLIVR